MDRRVDIGVAAAFALFGLFMIVNATTIRLGLYKDPIGPRAFFYGCGAIMLLGGAFTIWQRLKSWKRFPTHMIPMEGSADDEAYPSSAVRAFSVVLATVAYTILFQPLGFLLATPLYIIAALTILGQRAWFGKSMVAIVFTLSAYIIFAQVLGVRIGVGPFTNFFRDMGWIYI